MPLEVLATAVLPEGQFQVQSLAFSRDGGTLLAGLLSTEAFDDQLRVAAMPWATGAPVRSLALPHDALGRTNGLVLPIDHDLALATDRVDQELWRLSPRPERVATGAFAALGNGEVVAFDAPATLRWPGHAVAIAAELPVRAVALMANRSHAAFADRARIVCIGADGRERGAWPGTATRLAFAPDDLGLWGLSREAITWYPWQGAPVPFQVPGLFAWDFDAATRRALFAHSFELAELDLGTGRIQHHGAFRTGVPDACDPARRRVARLNPDDRFQVFQLT